MPRTRLLALPAAALTLTATLALTGCSSSSGSPGGSVTAVDGVRHLGVDDFASLASTPGVVLLDVRTPQEFATGHLANATVLDFSGGELAAKLGSLDKNATYAVYCHSGNRSGQALEQMKAAGFTHVADLEGGITAWNGAGRTIVTS